MDLFCGDGSSFSCSIFSGTGGFLCRASGVYGKRNISGGKASRPFVWSVDFDPAAFLRSGYGFALQSFGERKKLPEVMQRRGSAEEKMERDPPGLFAAASYYGGGGRRFLCPDNIRDDRCSDAF